MRIGIMGGTFDPIHISHLFVAEQAWQAFSLDRVLFVPTGDPPHKRHLADKFQRLRMVELAVAGHPAFEACPLEVERPGVTYTVDTMGALRAQYGPETVFFYIIGGDTLLDLTTWRESQRVMGMTRFIVLDRPGVDPETVRREAQRLRQDCGADIRFFPCDRLDVSSTMVRRRVRAGLSVRYLVPDGVRDYICENRLYRG
ncbi:MAG: nicotinate-nucleotide adenylyltransferase [Christensenellales bacterium]